MLEIKKSQLEQIRAKDASVITLLTFSKGNFGKYTLSIEKLMLGYWFYLISQVMCYPTPNLFIWQLNYLKLTIIHFLEKVILLYEIR